MKPFPKYLILLVLMFSSSVHASATQSFYFNSNQLSIVISINGSLDEKPDSLLIEEVVNGLPYILGLDNLMRAKKSERYTLLLKKSIKSPWDITFESNTGQIYDRLVLDSPIDSVLCGIAQEKLSLKVQPVNVFNGYTLEIVVNPCQKKQKILDFWIGQVLNLKEFSIYMGGEITQPLMWTQKLNGRNCVINIGLFLSISEAESIKKILNEKEGTKIEIVPLSLEIENLRTLLDSN